MDTPATTTPARNEPCPCGSTRKYKHCHSANDQAATAAPVPDGSGSPTMGVQSRAMRRLQRAKLSRRVRAGEGNALSELRAFISGVAFDRLFVVRTSDTSKANFDAMRQMSLGNQDDPAVAWAMGLGMDVVMPWGEDLRRSLGVFRVERRHVPGGTGTALLGYLIPSPDRRTLFAFVLNSAATANVVLSTAAGDEDRNAFTELLCTLLQHGRPRELHTPLLTRLIRDSRWAGQVGTSLRSAGTTLIVNNTTQNLLDKTDQFLFDVLCGVAAKDRRDIIERLGGIEGTIRSAGKWYGGENLLPFTWRHRSEYRTDPLTGESQRHVLDKQEVEPTPHGARVLRLLVDLAKDRSNHMVDIAVGLGHAGITSRAPKHASNPPTLDRLKDPASAATSLLQIEWINAWRYGTYEIVTVVHDDALAALPSTAITVVGADGRTYLESEATMPAPSGGWGIDDGEWDEIIQLRLATTPQRRGRRNSGPDLRVLSSVVQYIEDDRQWRLATFSSGNYYDVLSRPADCAIQGHEHVAWKTTAPVNTCHARLSGEPTHSALADALEAAIAGVESGIAPLHLAPAGPREVNPEQLAAATEALEDAENTLMVKETFRDGNTIAKLRDAFDADVEVARTRVAEARMRLESLSGTEVPASRAAGDTGEFDSIDIEMLIAALRRGPAKLPPIFNAIAGEIFADTLRMVSLDRGARWKLVGEVRLALEDGTAVAIPIETSPIPAIAAKHRETPGQAWHPASNEQVDTDTLAQLFFLDGHSIPAIGRIRGTDSTGRTSSWLFKELCSWLGSRGVPRPLATVILDIPIAATRRELYEALVTGSTTPFGAHLKATYTSPDTVAGTIWAHGDWQRARDLHDVLVAAGLADETLSACDAADRAQLPYTAAVKLTHEGRPSRADATRGQRRPPLFTKNFQRLTKLAIADRHFSLRTCPHCRRNAAGPALVPVLCPEVPSGLLCPVCRRDPANSTVVFPPEYLRRWASAGRRQMLATSNGDVCVGSLLRSGEPTDGTVDPS
ncbi:SEC-C domain-containing protein [Iamia sp. SCSIO 61187]|uniref:YecA family protein n=1 Tax=Iamia sp. SCSIO 61187 TaxID=2722752 RepID=UPI001C6360DC|nr:SEC-C domain-containing protein [Iamia sp. SCSIO 61187]QYG91063.1 SEC-C domain-containing protein [Iamia sp. SCSIO 61187]